MADNLPDLSGSKIQETFQRVLHTDGASIFDGTGSTILASTELSSLQTMNNNTILNADWGYVESMNQDVGTGADVNFTSITASANITTSGDMYCDSIHTTGTTVYVGGTPINKVLMDNVRRGFDDTNDSAADEGYGSDVARIAKINTDEVTTARVVSSGNISAAGNISASGNIYFNTITGGTF